MCMCEKCSKLSALLVLVAGILFLLQDLKVWDFWGISWWAVAFILYGVGSLASSMCPDCNACCGSGCCSVEEPKKKK